jgi:hypothetical protein
MAFLYIYFIKSLLEIAKIAGGEVHSILINDTEVRDVC